MSQKHTADIESRSANFGLPTPKSTPPMPPVQRPRAWFDSNDPAKVNESLGHDLVNAFTKVFDISRKSNWPVMARFTKGTEEMGELGTCVLVEQGFMKHKTLKESSVGEAADTIICVLDTLYASWPETAREDLIRELTTQLFTKSDKWNTIVDDLNAPLPEAQRVVMPTGEAYTEI
jgi:hypothetical protein